MVVNEHGTGGKARIEGKDVSGKTGTAQVVSLTGRQAASATMDVRDHGFFVFFAPRDNPKISGIVFAEHGIHGSTAAPIAKYVMETFFAKREGRPLPAPPVSLRVAPSSEPREIQIGNGRAGGPGRDR
jgi:penicillin-binding protein 2